MTQLLQNAAYGTVLILIVAVLRWVLKDRLVPEARLALWAVCLFRLLTPAAPESALSLWGVPRLFAPQTQAQPAPSASYVAGYVPNLTAPAPAPQPDPGISWETVLLVLWLAVGAVLAVRYILAWTRTRRAVGCAILVEPSDPRYSPLPKCARLREGPMEGAPLTFGAVRPTVVLSPGLEGETLDCVLTHEGIHASRRDNLWHYVTALALVIHWWNPAVWLMSRLLRRDIELSCDRAAVRKLGEARRAEYANALVSLATQGSGPAFCHTFGRKAAEERILSIMKFKKTSIIGVIFSLTLVLAVTVAFASEPQEPQDDTVVFHGQTFSRSALSQETLDWLDWYLDLPEEQQLAVNYVPADLRGNQNPETNDAISYEDFKFSSTKFYPNPEKTKDIQSDFPEVDPDDVDLSKMKENLSDQVADGKLTQEEADAMMANAEDTLEQARRGELKLFFYTGTDGDEFFYGSGVFSTKDGQDQPVFSDPFGLMAPMYYKDENGNLVPIDSYTVTNGYVLDPRFDEYDNLTLHTEIDLSGSVMLLDEFLEGLAQRVEDGRLTQAEADQRIAFLLNMLDLKSLDEITDRSVLRITVHEEDFIAGAYAAFGPFKDTAAPAPAPSSAVSDSKSDATPVPSAAPDGATAQPLVNTAPSASCGVAGCTETRYHAHSGDCSFLLNTPCPVEGCTITGNHIHGDVCYSCNGAGHSGGVCDGSCYTSYNQPDTNTPTTVSTSTHHSESHHSSGHHSSHH